MTVQAQTNCNLELSEWVAKKVNARLGACWQNSFKGKKHLEKKTGLAVAYIEGHMWTEDMPPVEHGWLKIIETGVIVDPTRPLWPHERGVQYFEAHVHMDVSHYKKGDLPIVSQQQGHGWKDEKYVAAYNAAFTACMGISFDLTLEILKAMKKEMQ